MCRRKAIGPMLHNYRTKDKNVKSKLALLVSGLGILAVGPVWAGTINFDFANCASITAPSPLPGHCKGNLGTDWATFNDSTGTYQVTAYGGKVAQGKLVGDDLFVKQGGTGETGLGLSYTSDDEINAYQGVLLNVTDLASHGIDSGTAWLGSLQSGERGEVCDLTNSLGLLNCQSVKESANWQGSVNVTWGASDPYLVFFGASYCDGNFLLDSLTARIANSVPEPASVLLFGFGLAALLLVAARREGALGRRNGR